jgi:drug/metabolite transporter (DMT)-like permease
MKLGTFIQAIVNLSSLIACTAFSTAPSLSFQPAGQHGRLLRSSALHDTKESPTKESPTTVQDGTVDAPSSVVYYDNFLDDSLPDGVVCARGVCVLEDFHDDDDLSEIDLANQSMVDKVLNSYLGPRLALAFASILYGTNFPLGVIMNEAMTPSAATSARVVLAALALSPFLPKLSPSLAGPALLCGCFTALGYTTQSLALVTVSPATVAFLGAATVLVCPTLEALVDKKPMGLRESPQTWLAAALCLAGVGILELYDPNGGGMLEVGWGDALAILQAVGFGTSFFLTERMMRGQPDQALPITAVQVSVTAFICMLWCFADGWMFQPGNEAFALPGLFFEPSLRTAAFAVAWTGM